MQIREENKIKKEYLRKYRNLQRKAKELQMEIEAIESRYTGQAVTYSDMPKAPQSTGDLSDMAAKVDELLTYLAQIQTATIEAYTNISYSIEQLDNETEQLVLRLRYLAGLHWNDIATELHYAERTIYKIHGDALLHFKPIA